MGEKIEYPKFLFKRGARDVVVQSVESHQLFAADGYLTADEFDALGAEEPVAAAEEPPTDVFGAQEFAGLKADEAVKLVQATNDNEVLTSFRAAEENRAGGGRKTVLKVLADKIGDAAPAAAAE